MKISSILPSILQPRHSNGIMCTVITKYEGGSPLVLEEINFRMSYHPILDPLGHLINIYIYLKLYLSLRNIFSTFSGQNFKKC